MALNDGGFPSSTTPDAYKNFLRQQMLNNPTMNFNSGIGSDVMAPSNGGVTALAGGAPITSVGGNSGGMGGSGGIADLTAPPVGSEAYNTWQQQLWDSPQLGMSTVFGNLGLSRDPNSIF